MEKEYLSWEEFDEGCKELVKQIKKSKLSFQMIYTLPRGGLPIATTLAHLLDIQIVTTIKSEAEKQWGVLFVDDVSDTGDTILNNYPQHCNCKIATLHYKPKSRVKPDFYVWETDKWITYPWEVK